MIKSKILLLFKKNNFNHLIKIFIKNVALKNPLLVHQCNGFEFLVQTVINRDPCFPVFQDALITIITFLLSKSSSRRYIPVNIIQILIEPFTNTYEPNQQLRISRINAAQNAIVFFLRSWTGLLCFFSDPNAVNSLVQSLQLPDIDLVVCILSIKKTKSIFY